MLSKSAARAFFLIATTGFSAIFLGFTLDTMRRAPQQTQTSNLTPQALQDKHLWEANNCIGGHTLFGEGSGIGDLETADTSPDRHLAMTSGMVSAPLQAGLGHGLCQAPTCAHTPANDACHSSPA
jgi:hypothetical protein